MTFRAELIDELLKDHRTPEDLIGEGGIFKQLSQALIERCLSAELDTHLEEERSNPEPDLPRNRRNGHSKKTIKGDFGSSEVAIPRDRNGAEIYATEINCRFTFVPQLEVEPKILRVDPDLSPTYPLMMEAEFEH